MEITCPWRCKIKRILRVENALPEDALRSKRERLPQSPAGLRKVRDTRFETS